MRKTIIVCDRCGTEITGFPIRVIAEKVDRETGDFQEEPFDSDGHEDLDFCESCATKILAFAREALPTYLKVSATMPSVSALSESEQQPPPSPKSLTSKSPEGQ